MKLYQYEATVVRVIDADSIVVDLDLGFDLWQRSLRVRLSGIDAPERWTLPGEAAREFVIAALPAGKQVIISSEEYNPADKYGRCLATVFFQDGESLQARILAAGHAVPYDGGKRTP